jgi:hypothetical protein
MRRLTAMLTLIVCATAWAATAASGDGGPAPGISYGWEGVAARSGKIRYVTFPGAQNSVLAVVRVRGGRAVRFRWIRGAYGVPLVAYDGTTGGLSHDGRTLVLASEVRQLGPGAVSRFVVLGTRKLKIRATVRLRGLFSYDALSPEGSTLYLIEHLPSQNYARYSVRAYDLRARRLVAGAIVDRREPDERMTGQPITRLNSADGRWAYTLYRNDAGKPFVHALDTVDREAVCLDLPWRGSQDRLWSLRLETTRDGSKLLLVTRKGRTVMTVNAPG